jgi:hypothetical protein
VSPVNRTQDASLGREHRRAVPSRERNMKKLHKAWTLLDPSQRAGAIGLMVLMTIGMLLEMLGIGLVLPPLSLPISRHNS